MAATDTLVNIPYDDLKKALEAAKTPQELYKAIANAPFAHQVQMALLFLGFICFYIVDEARKIIRIGGYSDTEHYRMAVDGYNIDGNSFNPDEYLISLNDPGNSLADTIRQQKPISTEDWGTLSRPIAREDVARINQANSGIAYTKIYPVNGKVRGALMFNFFQYKDQMGDGQREFMQRYTQLVSTSLQ